MRDALKSLKRLWHDKCTVIERVEVENEDHTTGFEDRSVVINEPCKLSFETISGNGYNGTAATIVQKAKLFISADLDIKTGSIIIVTRGTREFKFKHSGEPGVFTNHQEIVLEPWREWA